MHDVVPTVDLQHCRGLRLAHTVLRRTGVRPFILLSNIEQMEAVSVADFKPVNERLRDTERSNREGWQNSFGITNLQKAKTICLLYNIM